MLYGETPCNPNMAILDLAEFGKLGRSLEHVLTMVDSTFASPYLQPVIKHGIDISMHSWHVILILNREGKNVVMIMYLSILCYGAVLIFHLSQCSSDFQNPSANIFSGEGNSSLFKEGSYYSPGR